MSKSVNFVYPCRSQILNEASLFTVARSSFATEKNPSQTNVLRSIGVATVEVLVLLLPVWSLTSLVPLPELLSTTPSPPLSPLSSSSVASVAYTATSGFISIWPKIRIDESLGSCGAWTVAKIHKTYSSFYSETVTWPSYQNLPVYVLPFPIGIFSSAAVK